MTVPARASATGAGSDHGPGPDEADPTTTPTAGPASGDASSADEQTGGPVALVEPPSDAELVESALATWRGSLVEAAGGSTLADIDLLGEAALDLSAAHPSGMAQLFAGRETRLSNLVREGAALSAARRRARAVGSRAAAYEQRYGIAPTSLAIGVATWTERTAGQVGQDDVVALASVTRAQSPAASPDQAPAEPRRLHAPVLLRPVALRARGTGRATTSSRSSRRSRSTRSWPAPCARAGPCSTPRRSRAARSRPAGSTRAARCSGSPPSARPCSRTSR
ncbi:MAG: hypothetical protein NVV66_13725 [Cellulomonas sp.]|uniref:hypothetical protein n=1 Tax=Cellulomonas sp. TaxID=40001 RepID=UPI00258AC024|nr:hypothetical protein [Cellulomonas sp.]MCR6705696.1 hypothetical protein [Cellulomonas sp.]